MTSELRYCCIIADDAGKIVREDRGYCPLQNVSVTGLIQDAVASYTLVQTYVNPLKDTAIEAVYSFPLYEGVAVSGFEVELDGRKIVGRVQEKVAARKEYELAKEAGKVASLLEEETPDTFQASVGNIPPSTTVAIRITLFSEVKQDGDENQVRFVMPTAIAPRYHYAPVEYVPSSSIDTSSTVLSVNMGIATSRFPIQSIKSPSHTIEVHMGTCSSESASSNADTFNPNHARVSLTADSPLDRDFVIIVKALGLDEPRALVERHPKDGTHAISLTFSPRFELNPIRSLELIFIMDRSGSMDGAPIKKAAEALELLLRSIPVEDHYFNVIGFGSSHECLFPKSVPYNADSLKKATLHAQRLKADLGGTEMMSAFQEVFKQRRRDVPLQIFLLTDGEIWYVDELCDIIREAVDEGERSNSFVRVFSLGIGDSVSHNLIESVARAGGGYAQLVMESERMERKLLNMLKSALVPPTTNLGVQWTSEDLLDSAPETEEFVLVEAEVNSPVVDSDEIDSTNKTPINLFSTSPEVPSPPPPPPAVPPPRVVVPIHQAPFKIPILCRGTRFAIYAILPSTVPIPKELVLQGLSPDGPVELKVKVEMSIQEGETTLHSLAARAIVRDLEEGASCIHALGRNATATQKEMLKRLGVHVVNSEGKKYANAELSSKHVIEITKDQILDIAMRYNMSSKYTSWVAIDEDTHESVIHDNYKGPKPSPSNDVTYFTPLAGVCRMPRASAIMTCCDTMMVCETVTTTVECPTSSTSEKSTLGHVEVVSKIEETTLESSTSEMITIHDMASEIGLPRPITIDDGMTMVMASDGAQVKCAWENVDADSTSDNESEEDRSEELITARDPHSQLRSILQHQSFDGSFPLVPEVAAFFETTVEDLNQKLAELRKQCALSTLSESEWETIWATCLAAEFMKTQLEELQDEWELVVEKAEMRVESLVRNVQDLATIKDAAAVLALMIGRTPKNNFNYDLMRCCHDADGKLVNFNEETAKSCASSATIVVGDVAEIRVEPPELIAVHP